MRQLKQKPDQNFAGTENLVEQTITLANVRSIGDDCDPNEFSEVFEIDASQLETQTFIRVTANLVSHGHGSNLVPNARIVRQSKFRNASPFLVLTLYEMPDGANPAPNSDARHEASARRGSTLALISPYREALCQKSQIQSPSPPSTSQPEAGPPSILSRLHRGWWAGRSANLAIYLVSKTLA